MIILIFDVDIVRGQVDIGLTLVEVAVNAIEVANLRKVFISRTGPLFKKKRQEIAAVEDVSFDIAPGTIFSLLQGPPPDCPYGQAFG